MPNGTLREQQTLNIEDEAAGIDEYLSTYIHYYFESHPIDTCFFVSIQKNQHIHLLFNFYCL
ncbi:hypothetical protein [Nodularia sp. UHCC 0506]|uniref:hypothetical protein n=1 Tax=Nodularia sp. UHCC 0506 TaxID=3110243 RepID=UPI002B21ADEB|nr:hypothetical protein [Nodularia sp. UHCC 0506]MEA5516534.1 hypothetical protein [Nodularia sp. UHCC 0506]